MSHATEIIAYEKIPETNLVVIHFKCCGEHDHPHTIGADVLSDPEKLAMSLEGAHKAAAKFHAAKQNESLLKAAIGQQVTHEL